jgi:hypothetical protein
MANPSIKKNKKPSIKTKKVGGVVPPKFLGNLVAKAKATVSNAKAAVTNRLSSSNKGTTSASNQGATVADPGHTAVTAATAVSPIASNNSLDMLQQPPISSAGAGPKIPQGVNEAFITMYKLITILCVLLVALLFIIGWIDVLYYIYNESSQEFRMIKDSNLFIQDTTDYDAFKYINTNTSDDEPYSIFLEESVVSYIYRFVGIFIILLAVQYGLFFSFMLYSRFNQLPFYDTVTLEYKLIGIIIIAYICAAIISTVYKKYFINHSQGTLKNIRSHLRDMKLYIYSHLTLNTDYLTAMIKNDTPALLSILNAEIVKNNRNLCSSPTSNCDAEVQRMIFTYSLYTYYNDQIPQADPNYNTMQEIFTIDNIQKRKIDPSIYFYYKQPIIISNMYPEFLKVNTKPFFTDPSRENRLLAEINNILQTCNKKLSLLQTLPEGKRSLFKYILTFAAVTTVFAGIYIGMYYTELKPALEWLLTNFKKLLQWLWSVLKYPFTKHT